MDKEAREKIVRQIWRSGLAGEISIRGRPDAYPKDEEWEELDNDSRQFWYRQADQILSLKYPSGTPILAVLNEKQELPKMPSRLRYPISHEIVADMLKAGWKKCL